MAVNANGHQRQVDYQGGEVVYLRVIVMVSPLRVLVGPVADLGAGFPKELGQIYAVVVNEAQPARFLDHDVAVLQVVVGDFKAAKGSVDPAPTGGQAHDDVRPVEMTLDELVQPVALSPVHPDDGVPVALYPYAAFDVLETDKGLRPDSPEVFAQMAVALLLVLDLAGEAAHGDITTGGGHLEHAGEIAREGQWDSPGC